MMTRPLTHLTASVALLLSVTVTHSFCRAKEKVHVDCSKLSVTKDIANDIIAACKNVLDEQCIGKRVNEIQNNCPTRGIWIEKFSKSKSNATLIFVSRIVGNPWNHPFRTKLDLLIENSGPKIKKLEIQPICDPATLLELLSACPKAEEIERILARRQNRNTSDPRRDKKALQSLFSDGFSSISRECETSQIVGVRAYSTYCKSQDDPSSNPSQPFNRTYFFFDSEERLVGYSKRHSSSQPETPGKIADDEYVFAEIIRHLGSETSQEKPCRYLLVDKSAHSLADACNVEVGLSLGKEFVDIPAGMVAAFIERNHIPQALPLITVSLTVQLISAASWEKSRRIQASDRSAIPKLQCLQPVISLALPVYSKGRLEALAYGAVYWGFLHAKGKLFYLVKKPNGLWCIQGSFTIYRE